jgi:hypothetical protein
MNLLEVLFGKEIGHAVAVALCFNRFDVSFTKDARDVAFLAGQPLGFLSSWPLFGLCHHLVVWHAAEQCYPGRKFKRYALLGDDLVLADDRVAKPKLTLKFFGSFKLRSLHRNQRFLRLEVWSLQNAFV